MFDTLNNVNNSDLLNDVIGAPHPRVCIDSSEEQNNYNKNIPLENDCVDTSEEQNNKNKSIPSENNCVASQHGSQYSEGIFHPIDATTLLQKIRIRNINKLIIGSLNINSLANKIEQMKLIIENNID